MKTCRSALAVAIALVPAVPSVVHAQQDVTEEINKQVSKLIGDAISSRISGEVADEQVVDRPTTPTERNNVWFSYTSLHLKFSGEDFGSDFSSNSRTNLYLAGYDLDISDKLLVGASGSYSTTSGFDSRTWGVTPYLAYRFTKYIFGIASFDYVRSEDSFSQSFSDGGLNTTTKSDSTTNSYAARASLNGVYRAGNVLTRGRLELARSKSVSDTTSSFSCDPTLPPGFCQAGSEDSTTMWVTSYLGDGELGYFFAPRVYGFAGVQLGASNQDNSYFANVRVGLEAFVARSWALFAKYERRVDDDLPSSIDLDAYSWTVGARVRF